MYAFTFCIQKFGYSQTLFSNIECIVQICFMLTGPQQAIVNNIRSAKYIQQINNTCRLLPYTLHHLNDLTSWMGVITRGTPTPYNTHQKSWNTCVCLRFPDVDLGISRLSAPKDAWLNNGEGEGHIWVRRKVWRVNVRNFRKNKFKRNSFCFNDLWWVL